MFTGAMVQIVKNLTIETGGVKNLSKSPIHHLIQDLKSELKIDISSLIINFVSEKEIIEINKKYLGHNYSTDIITFDYAEDSQNIDAELFISYKEAELNAKKFRVTINEEITRLIIHGILHLIGFIDKDKNDRLIMKKFENKLLKKYKFHLL